MSEFILEMKDICKSFSGIKALNHAGLQLKAGKTLALMGENGAGKSTLMKCMFGIYKTDEGKILLDGQPVTIKNPTDALQKGIAMVHQELQPVPEMTIGENIFLGRYPMKKALGIFNVIDYEKMYADAAAVLKKVGMNFDPEEKLKILSVSQMQSVEIAKAVSANCRILILDEPTSSLTQNEVDSLFRIIDTLKAEGVAVVYISHKMNEILKIADDVSIMRDGQLIGTWPADTLTTDFIITKMVGRELSNLYPLRVSKPSEVLLEVKDFTSIDSKSFRNVSFKLRKGEILGVAGLVGAQRTELMESLFGTRSHAKGQIFYKGKELKISKPKDAIDYGIAMLTEDRRLSGIMGVLPVSDNISIASLRKYLKKNVYLDSKKIDKLVETNVKKMNIKVPSGKTCIKNLSGGNQQKVLIGRWLANNPDILILDEPTRGIDVGAKYEIYCIISKLVEEGKGVIMVSSEMSELIGMSDRIMVMCEGRVTGIIEGKNATQEGIMTLATQFS